MTLEFQVQNNSDHEVQKMKVDLQYDPDQGLEVVDQISQHSIKQGASGKIFVNLSKSSYAQN